MLQKAKEHVRCLGKYTDVSRLYDLVHKGAVEMARSYALGLKASLPPAGRAELDYLLVCLYLA